MIDFSKKLKQGLTKYLIQRPIIPCQYLSELNLELDQSLADTSLNSAFYFERLTSFWFDLPTGFFDSQSKKMEIRLS